jgi:hypothetical protein
MAPCHTVPMVSLSVNGGRCQGETVVLVDDSFRQTELMHPRHPSSTSAGADALCEAGAGWIRSLWVPNWSSMAVTWGGARK